MQELWCSRYKLTLITPQIVLNPPSYPNFLGFLKWASIDCVPTEMTFSVSRNRGEFEWAGDNLRTLFCQFMNIFKLDMWRLVYDIIKFNACCRRLLANVDDRNYLNMSIGEYVSSEGYSPSFVDNYLMVSLVRRHALGLTVHWCSQWPHACGARRPTYAFEISLPSLWYDAQVKRLAIGVLIVNFRSNSSITITFCNWPENQSGWLSWAGGK
jgi:hypothetical protein